MKIIAVDFDGTIVKDAYPGIGEVYSGTVSYLKYLQSIDCKLILWTCRSGKQLEEAIKVCKENGLEFNAINDNLPETIEKYGNNSRKIYADIYIDDRAFIPAEFYMEQIGKGA